MQIFNGKGAYGAIAIGAVKVIKKPDAHISRVKINDVEAELARLSAAKQRAVGELNEIYRTALTEVGADDAQIFKLHIQLLEDEDYNETIQRTVAAQSVNAEYAISEAADKFSAVFANMDDAYMQARAADIRDISERLTACLDEGRSAGTTLSEPAVVCADELTPSETVLLDKSKLLALVTAYGSPSSHTAILARSMSIPAVIGVGKEFLEAIRDGDIIAVDGFTGKVYLSPDSETASEMERRRKENMEEARSLEKLKGKENITLDGKRISVYANVGSVSDVVSVLDNDAEGIGLFRSEFLYLEGNDYPNEEAQLEAYKSVLIGMGDKKVIIRTLDIGADKKVGYFKLDSEENPALGLRAIRLCLTRPELFKVQLRALFRASVFGKLGIMFPMLTSVSELERILALCDEVRAELRAEGLEYSDETELGIMIETPAAALISDRLAPMVDFFSVGTNDLIQYTLACDRQNPRLEEFCDTHHAAVMKLIELSASNAHANGAWIGICGELAADTELTKDFIGMGIDELSVAPSYVLKLRSVIRGLSLT